MATKKSVGYEIISLSNIKGIVEAFEEIAAVRITRTQDAVLRSRQFASEINDIFQDIKSSSKRDITIIMKQKKVADLKKLSFLSKNGKTLFVYLSANTGLYGNIVRRTFDLFTRYVGEFADNVLIVGKVGLKLARDNGITKPVAYFDFPDSKVDEEQLQKIASYMIQFERVVVFYGAVESILRQKETMLDISGNPEPSHEQQEKVETKYFLEPDVNKILAFFEKEIFASIFEQAVREFQLAKLSSRVVGLNSTIDNIDLELKKTIIKKERLKHEEANRKQLQTFSSMSLWNT